MWNPCTSLSDMISGLYCKYFNYFTTIIYINIEFYRFSHINLFTLGNPFSLLNTKPLLTSRSTLFSLSKMNFNMLQEQKNIVKTRNNLCILICDFYQKKNHINNSISADTICNLTINKLDIETLQFLFNLTNKNYFFRNKSIKKLWFQIIQFIWNFNFYIHLNELKLLLTMYMLSHNTTQHNTTQHNTTQQHNTT